MVIAMKAASHLVVPVMLPSLFESRDWKLWLDGGSIAALRLLAPDRDAAAA
jgi:hypothetical protein